MVVLVGEALADLWNVWFLEFIDFGVDVASTQSNLYRQIRREVSRNGYAE